MSLVGNLVVVFLAGLATALATGLGALPFFLVDDVSDRWNVALWGVASGIMISASIFGLLNEGLAASEGFPTILLAGVVVGVLLVLVADNLLDRVDVAKYADDGPEQATDGGAVEEVPKHEDAGHDHEEDSEHDHDHAELVHPTVVAEGDIKTLVLVLGILTVHSFPEGVAIGVSFADMGLAGGIGLLGLTVPVLAIMMTVAISIHNIPEGLAISIPLRAMGVGGWRMVGAAVFSSLPQPIGAVIAFAFVRYARDFLPFGFGFAAGAMVFLVLSEFIPDALKAGEQLESKGYPELAVGLVAGFAVMVPFAFM
ncbi:ZIP family metal transporter [Haloarchaeobius iranensis]|uniref:Zinc transporter, ZIP family n=1 Tax=Haloarchaeobius iranensis TaxID=996166 RepID=A0A1G9Z2F2_9EURY|nr:ZIP family metal transporter [Haloarchaeobius iranensis]SDN14923.1 zinc transporter, ZIP family [Haloarchaeobius iranensis]